MTLLLLPLLLACVLSLGSATEFTHYQNTSIFTFDGNTQSKFLVEVRNFTALVNQSLLFDDLSNIRFSRTLEYSLNESIPNGTALDFLYIPELDSVFNDDSKYFVVDYGSAPTQTSFIYTLLGANISARTFPTSIQRTELRSEDCSSEEFCPWASTDSDVIVLPDSSYITGEGFSFPIRLNAVVIIVNGNLTYSRSNFSFALGRGGSGNETHAPGGGGHAGLGGEGGCTCGISASGTSCTVTACDKIGAGDAYGQNGDAFDLDVGSPGGAANSNPSFNFSVYGGYGGGAIELRASWVIFPNSNTIIDVSGSDGLSSSNPEPSAPSGGGSGGSAYVNAFAIKHKGLTMKANGGNGGQQYSTASEGNVDYGWMIAPGSGSGGLLQYRYQSLDSDVIAETDMVAQAGSVSSDAATTRRGTIGTFGTPVIKRVDDQWAFPLLTTDTATIESAFFVPSAIVEESDSSSAAVPIIGAVLVIACLCCIGLVSFFVWRHYRRGTSDRAEAHALDVVTSLRRSSSIATNLRSSSSAGGNLGFPAPGCLCMARRDGDWIKAVIEEVGSNQIYVVYDDDQQKAWVGMLDVKTRAVLSATGSVAGSLAGSRAGSIMGSRAGSVRGSPTRSRRGSNSGQYGAPNVTSYGSPMLPPPSHPARGATGVPGGSGNSSRLSIREVFAQETGQDPLPYTNKPVHQSSTVNLLGSAMPANANSYDQTYGSVAQQNFVDTSAGTSGLDNYGSVGYAAGGGGGSGYGGYDPNAGYYGEDDGGYYQ